MKKSYVKPQVYFEDFQLSASIAAGCTFKTNHAKNDCAYNVGGKYLFVDSVQSCTTTTQDGTWDSICYDIPNDSTRLFTS